MSKRIDFQAIKNAALNRIDSVLARWLPDGQREGGEYVALNPTRNDSKKGSFSVNTTSGVWSDFATGDTGDIIKLVAYVDGCTDKDAAEHLAEFLGLHQGGDNPSGAANSTRNAKAAPAPTASGMKPVPDSYIKACPVAHPKLGKPSQSWNYLDGQGRLLMKVLRFDVITNGQPDKEYRPLTFSHGTGAAPIKQWQWKQPPHNRPLYGLETLTKHSADTPVLLVEGEKAADHARRLLPDNPVLTWPGGSKAISKANFRPLAGRDIWYWPDNDDAGKGSVATLQGAVLAAGAVSVAVFNLALLDSHKPSGIGDSARIDSASGQWPNKADAADAWGLGWRAEHIALLADKGLVVAAPAAQTENAADGPSPITGHYRSDRTGLYYLDLKSQQYRRMGGRLDVLAKSRNSDSRSWGTLVSFDDQDGIAREWNIPATYFAKEGGSEVVSGLLDRGYFLKTSREAKKRLIEYLGDYKTDNRIRLVERLGWFGNAFLLPEGAIGNPTEPLHYYCEGAPACKISQRGTVAEWRDNIGFYCAGNSLPTFAICAAFAAPLLDILQSEPCGFHFVGDSSLGKSTLLKLAASVYGNPQQYVRTWRATDNALEATAAAHSDCLLALDEIGQIDPRIVGETVYMLGNGEGKSRANEFGRSRGVEHRWRLVFISSGEKTLQAHMAEAGKKPQAGMEARLLTIPANMHKDSNTRLKLGIYQDAHTFPGGAPLSDHLSGACNQYHGAVAIEFIKALTDTSRRAEVIEHVIRARERFSGLLAGRDISGQVARASDKFALLAVAGEIATELGLTGWQRGWATSAVRECFTAWLNQRGSTGNLEDSQTLEHIRSMISRYGESRFTRWDSEAAKIDEHAPRTLERWGFRRTTATDEFAGETTTESMFYLTRTGFADMCPGIEIKRAARLLADIGALETDSEQGRLTKKARLPGAGKSAVNCYVIKASALFAEADSMIAGNKT